MYAWWVYIMCSPKSLSMQNMRDFDPVIILDVEHVF